MCMAYFIFLKSHVLFLLRFAVDKLGCPNCIGFLATEVKETYTGLKF